MTFDQNHADALRDLAEVEAVRDRFARAIARVVVLETSDLNCDAQIKAAIARGDGAHTLFYAGAQAMLSRVHAALREATDG